MRYAVSGSNNFLENAIGIEKRAESNECLPGKRDLSTGVDGRSVRGDEGRSIRRGISRAGDSGKRSLRIPEDASSTDGEIGGEGYIAVIGDGRSEAWIGEAKTEASASRRRIAIARDG